MRNECGLCKQAYHPTITKETLNKYVDEASVANYDAEVDDYALYLKALYRGTVGVERKRKRLTESYEELNSKIQKIQEELRLLSGKDCTSIFEIAHRPPEPYSPSTAEMVREWRLLRYEPGEGEMTSEEEAEAYVFNDAYDRSQREEWTNRRRNS